MDTSTLRQNIQSLVEKFDRDKYHYLSKDYLEAQTRKDFIDPLFEALGWDISNKAGLPPFEREVLLEKGETSGRPDYNFRLGGASKFFVEAKAPPESLDSVRHVLQAKSYAWNTKEVFIAVLTDFEGLKVFDASLTPDRKTPLQGLIIDLKYTEYLNNLDKLLLLSKEAVSQGSLERLLLKDAKSKRQRIPVDKKFLQDMGLWREGLAKDAYRHDPSISVRTLNEVVQRLLDRIVFIRIAEDRKIIEPRTLFEIAQLWKAEGKKRPIQYHLNNLFREINADLNGDIFKPHACEQYEADSQLLAEIIEDLYFPTSPYLFDVIGVELLGSIYERYLGSTIRVTPGGRVKVEEKQEVRKAGGVYYTPQYIVKYIVENTVGRLIEGKTPKQIEKIKILDPACGSGSFLLGAYQYLIDYHIKYYREHPKEAHAHPLFPDLIGDQEGRGDPSASGGRPHRLSIIKKGHILRNNLFGVDIDPQAVEITMMSLYLKALEGERTLPRKQGLLPVLSDNIKCGNSLIGYDIFDVSVGATRRVAPTKGQGILVGAGLPHPHITDEERERINPFDWNSRSAGFGEIMERGGFDCVIGNPPYVRQEMLKGGKWYFESKYQTFTSTADIYVLFIERALKVLKEKGRFSFIVSNKYTRANYGERLRRFLLNNANIEQFNDFEDLPVFEKVSTYPSIMVLEKTKNPSNKDIQVCIFRKLPCDKINEYINEHSFKLAQKSLTSEPWIFVDKKKILLKEKIRSVGQPLVEYCGEPKSGIKTGLNKALIVTEDRMEEIIGKSDFEREIYRPILRARDIERWSYNFADLFIIFLEGKDIKNYPKTKQYLENFKSELSKRSDIAGKPNRRWYDLRECAYYDKYDKPKIIYPDISIQCKFAFDENKVLLNNTAYLIDRDDKYLLGILNSKLIEFYFGLISAKFRGGYYRFIPIYINHLPIRTINFDNPKEKAMHYRLVTLVDRMLGLNKKRHTLPAASQREVVEREIAVTDERIDDLVYELYGITKGERAIIEGTDRK